jgi:hypothetical protein
MFITAKRPRTPTPHQENNTIAGGIKPNPNIAARPLTRSPTSPSKDKAAHIINKMKKSQEKKLFTVYIFFKLYSKHLFCQT